MAVLILFIFFSIDAGLFCSGKVQAGAKGRAKQTIRLLHAIARGLVDRVHLLVRLVEGAIGHAVVVRR